jgi:hypothetical protein
MVQTSLIPSLFVLLCLLHLSFAAPLGSGFAEDKPVKDKLQKVAQAQSEHDTFDVPDLTGTGYIVALHL